VLGIIFWVNGADNLGALVFIGGIVGNSYYLWRLDSGGPSVFREQEEWKERNSLRAQYDKDGNVVGYVDKE
jgi:hypothetical protein